MINVLRGIVVTLLAVAVATFVADWAIFKLTGSPTAIITVHKFVSAPLKNNKQELDYVGSEETPCSASMLPQSGMAPCWYLRNHTNQVTTY